VTGAAGSIGSEICSQIAACAPGALIGFDQARNHLHCNEAWRRNFRNSPSTPKSAVSRASKMSIEFQSIPSVHRFPPAGLKHAPLMEPTSLRPSKTTLRHLIAAEAAAANGAECFIKVSTDKQCCPLASWVLPARGRAGLVAMQKNRLERNCLLRLGNVLGSSGVLQRYSPSRLPGGPLTVTYPAMERYFMTLRESKPGVFMPHPFAKRRDLCTRTRNTRESPRSCRKAHPPAWP